MGTGDDESVADGGGASVICSICMEAVADDGTKSWAKLVCGHQFHLDCIGSGAMQCPNCRRVENGEWLYANDSQPSPDFAMDDWAEEEDTTFDLNHGEMSFGVHWCPFGGFTRLSTFEDGEYPSTTYHNLYAEVTPMSSTSHPCPYFANGPSHGSISDGPTYVGYWSAPSLTNDAFVGPYAYPSAAHSWNYFGPTNHMVGGQRTGHNNSSDLPRPVMHPFPLGSSITASSSYTPPAHHRRSAALRPNFEQNEVSPQVSSNGQRSSAGHREGSAYGAPSLAEQQSWEVFNYYCYCSAVSSALQYWERDDSTPQSILGPSYPPNGSSCSWHGSSQNGS